MSAPHVASVGAPRSPGASGALPERAAEEGTMLERPVRPVLDVSDLPNVVFGPRDMGFWGTLGFMVAEGMTLATLVVAYFYVRRNFDAWPPLGTPLPDLLIGTLSLVVLLACAAPAYLADRAAKRLDPRGVRTWLWAATALEAVATVLRYLELEGTHTRWNTNAYGSALWVAMILHGTLILTDVLETGTLAAIFSADKHEGKHFVAATDNSLYTYFMVLVWVPLYVIFYLYPRWS